MRHARWLSGLRGDLRRAGRLHAANPWFTAVAILTIGLGVGANTAIFSVVNTVLIDPLPYRAPEQLVVVLQQGASPVSPANLLEWRDQTSSYEGLAAAELWTTTLTGGEGPERLTAVRVTPNLFPLLGVRPAIGQLPGPDDDHSDAGPVLLGHQLWQRRFGGDAGIVGRAILVNGAPRVVAGVMEPNFRFPPFWAANAELWTPLPLAGRTASRSESLRLFGRLKPGVTLAAARAEMAAVTARLEAEFPGTNRNIEVTGLLDRVVGGTRPALLLLSGAVGFVLLIACANVAHLLLSRAETRRRELAVRAALGASRLQLGRQAAVENGLLVVAGGAVGLGIAWMAVSVLPRFGPVGIPRLADVALDGVVLLYSLATTVGTALVFGLLPLRGMGRVDLTEALKSGGARGAVGSRQGGRWRDLMVASQFALAVVLLTGAGLSVRSMIARLSLDPGFQPDGVTTMEMSVAGTQAGLPDRRAGFYREVVDRIGRLPGVAGASTINHLPLAGDAWQQAYRPEGAPLPAPGAETRATYRVVMPGYFAVVRLPLGAGRDFSDDDAADRPLTVIVNEALAARAWPGQDPLGRRLALGGAENPAWLTVVGVAANAVRSDWTAEPAEEVYLPLGQSRAYLESPSPVFGYQTLVIRTAADPSATAAAVRTLVAQLDRDVPISAVQTLRSVVNRANAEPGFYLFLLAAFATLAVVLAAVGIYGVMRYTVATRTREIGIRMTLGATRAGIVRLVAGRGLGVAMAGAAAGLLAAAWLTRFMRGMLHDVAPLDPLTFALVPVALGIVGAVASVIPARRAAGIDPGVAVRGSDES